MRRITPISFLASLATLVALACGSAPSDQSAANTASDTISLTSATGSAPSLGAAASFALLGGTAVTCTDATVAGNVGVYPGVTITQTSCPVTGTIDAGDTVAA